MSITEQARGGARPIERDARDLGPAPPREPAAPAAAHPAAGPGAAPAALGAFDVLLEGIVIFDGDGRPVYANQSALAILGLAREHLVGRKLSEGPWHMIREDGTPCPEEDQPAAVAIRTGERISQRVVGLVKPGERQWLLTNAAPFGAGPERGAVTTFVDVTHERAARAELAGSERRLRAVLAAAEGVLLLVHADGSTEVLNEELVEDAGIPREQRPATLMKWAELVVPADQPALIAAFTDAYRRPGVGIPIGCRFQVDGRPVRELVGSVTNLIGEAAVGAMVVHLRDPALSARRSPARGVHSPGIDPLTGLRVDESFTDALDDLLARDGAEPVTVVLIDIADLRLVNETHGPDVGDAILVEAAGRLRATVGAAEVLGRTAGGEFGIACTRCTTLSAVATTAQHLQQTITGAYEIDGREIYIDAHTGVARGERVPAAMLRGDANAALRVAKTQRSRTPVLFEERYRNAALRHLDLDLALRHAVERHEFRLDFQPIVDLATHGVAGYEALLRWDRPGHGIVAPGGFLPAAEENGLIVPIGVWVVEEAARAARSMPPGQSISVNIAAVQLRDPALAAALERVRLRYELAVGALALEIGEATRLESSQAGMTALREAHRLGISILLDDFGTGTSSLQSLRNLPLDAVKIDRSIVAAAATDERARLLAAAAIQLAHDFGLRTVAEGVETVDQHHTVVELGCDRAQGFLYARPGPVEVLHELGSRAALATGTLLSGAG